MFIQIEITTHCNFSCFYCAGRDMPQKHISWEVFSKILSELPPGRHTLSLQGEGEPIVHRGFWRMVEMVVERGHVPYTITNGSHLDAEKIKRHFPSIGISLDTVDENEAERIGRHDLPKVLGNIERLIETYPPRCIVIHTVDYGQEKEPLRAYLRRLGITRHAVQPLQTKDDYAYRYPGLIPVKFIDYTYSCRYIDAPLRKFYTIDGVELPCCFIKDVRNFVSIAHIRESFEKKIAPPCCAGCREITREKAIGSPRSVLAGNSGALDSAY